MIGTLLFNVMHYALRPWPWIIVALASTARLPAALRHLGRIPGHGSVDARPRHRLSGDDALPPRGIPRSRRRRHCSPRISRRSRRISTGARATSSTIFYRRFLRPGLSEKHYVLVGRLTTAGLMVVAALHDLRARHGEGSVRAHPLHRRGNGTALPAALVLVARQRVERDRRHGELFPRRARILHRAQERARDACARLAAGDGRRRRRWSGWRRRSSRRPDRRRHAGSLLHARPSLRSRLGAGRAPHRGARLRRLRCRRRCSAGCSAAPSSTPRCSAREVCSTERCHSS